MDPKIISFLAIAGLFVFMMFGVPIVYSLGASALIAGFLAFGSGTLHMVGSSPFSMLFNLGWTPLPLFVLLGAIIAESGMGKDLFHAAANWLSRVKGGLIVAGIIGEAMLAATLGTSAACIIVVGKVAVPEFEKQGYNRGFSIGALLAGGVLGPLIPPSATMIIYGVLTNVSLGRLFIAGIIPGIILVFFLAIPAVVICILRPNLAPKTYSV
ncbi:MAG TPA: TRAP transporter large permease subunit, partial [Dehalococcoidales bacterium]